MRAAIGIMCKAPRAGTTKTRLAPVVGEENAARLSGCFLRDVAATIAGLPETCRAQGVAVFSPQGAEAELRALLPADFAFLFKTAPDFGEVLLDAARHLLAHGHDCVLLINADSPTLPSSLLEDAIAALRRPGERVVFGPALDGGYYLIGLKSAHARLFEEIAWSTQVVLAQSLARAREIGLEVVTLEAWYDVDDAAGLAVLRSELAGERPSSLTSNRKGAPARATRALLASLFQEERANAVEEAE